MYTKPDKFKYFRYATDLAQYRWCLDDVKRMMFQSSQGLPGKPSSMKSYCYAEFVGGNFNIDWVELDREMYLKCSVT